MPDSVSDAGADLARWAAAGDRAALDRVLAAASAAAHAQACRLLGRSSDADDATQEALVQLVRSARRFDPQRPFRPWLARLVHDACCRLLRSGRRRRRHEGAVPPPPPSAEPVDGEAVRAAVLELPESLRAAVELHYFAGLDQAEAAAALGIGEGACAMRLSRARERLRGLLQRRGLGVTAAVALAALTAAPAQAAPAELAAGVADQAAAGTLPATTIPLTTMQTGAWFMATHPILTTAAAAALVAALALPFALLGAAEPVVPAPVPVPAVARLSASARALLPYLDPAAPMRLALDLETLRPELLTAKPFSLLADPRMAQVTQAWRGARLPLLGKLARTVIEDGRAMTIALHDTTRGRRPEGRLLMLADCGPGTGPVAEALSSAREKGEQAPPAVGPFTGILMEDGELFVGRAGSTLAIATATWLRERAVAAPAPEPPAAAWFGFDAGPLIARYVALSGPDGDPAGVAPLLGAGWRRHKPVIDGRIAGAGTEIVGSVRVSGAAPFSPLVPLTLLVGGTVSLPFGDCAAWPMRRPALGIPASGDRVASLSLGLAPPPAAQPFTKAVTEWDRSTPTMPRDLVQRMLAAAWSGDLALEIRPGAPLPRAAVVLGLRPGTDPVEAARQIAVWLQLPQGTLDQSGPLPRSVSGVTPAGQVVIAAYLDRLVATVNADPAEWPGIATAAAARDAVSCSIRVDLPAMLRTWGPLVLALVPADQRALVPPLPVLLEHLPVWTMDWEATADGCRIAERGLPLAVILTAAASIRTVLEADPERETDGGAPQPQTDPAAQPPAVF